MARYVLTDLARADIREILGYLQGRSPQAADNVRARLYDAMGRLAQFPGMGHRRDDVTSEAVRFWSVHSYLIIYRSEIRPIQIIRVLHGARDLPRFFSN